MYLFLEIYIPASKIINVVEGWLVHYKQIERTYFMGTQVQLKPKKDRTFFDWLVIKKIPQRSPGVVFLVPPHIESLPCGCQRNVGDSPFKVKNTIDGKLLHHRGWSDGRSNHCTLIKGEVLIHPVEIVQYEMARV